MVARYNQESRSSSFRHHNYNTFDRVKLSTKEQKGCVIPAWACGSERNTLVFHMLGVTASGPQFRKPENSRKVILDVQAHAQ